MNPLFLILAGTAFYFVTQSKSTGSVKKSSPPASCEILCLPNNNLVLEQYLINNVGEFENLIKVKGLTDPYVIAKNLSYFKNCGLSKVNPDSTLTLKYIYVNCVKFSALFLYFFQKWSKEKTLNFLINEYPKLLKYLKLLEVGIITDGMKNRISENSGTVLVGRIKDFLNSYPITKNIDPEILAWAITINEAESFGYTFKEKNCFTVTSVMSSDFSNLSGKINPLIKSYIDETVQAILKNK